jgi:hypothetical protein
VVYTRSGQYLAACRIDDPDILIEQTLYWCKVDTIEEGRYLCAIINSNALAEAVRPLQSRGQHNPRDFAMSLFAISFPTFDPANAVHAEIASLAERAEAVVAALALDEGWQFQKARRVVREALRADGIGLEIDRAVHTLLAWATSRSEDASAADAEPQPPSDPLGALTDAMRRLNPAGAATPRGSRTQAGKTAKRNEAQHPGRGRAV